VRRLEGLAAVDENCGEEEWVDLEVEAVGAPYEVEPGVIKPKEKRPSDGGGREDIAATERNS
jgi:hypothetical protein